MSQVSKNSFNKLISAWFPKATADAFDALARRNERSRGGELRLAVQHWLNLHRENNDDVAEQILNLD